MASHWRRFLPQRKKSQAMVDASDQLNRVRSIEDAGQLIERLKHDDAPMAQAARAVYYRSLLLAQTPRAAKAQIQMDTHEHGYHNREKRLFELIDFNDAFVSYVLATPHAELPGLADHLKIDMAAFCRRLNSTMFSDEQLDAITRGLSREIAVYRGAIHEGYRVEMTSRSEDAFGIDMIVHDSQSDKQLNIDCKTPSAFRHRLEDLVKYGDISDDTLLQADEDDFLIQERKKDNKIILVTLFCVRPETLGDIHDFTFSDTVALGRQLQTIFSRLP